MPLFAHNFKSYIFTLFLASMANLGKKWQIEDVKSSKTVVKISYFDYRHTPHGKCRTPMEEFHLEKNLPCNMQGIFTQL